MSSEVHPVQLAAASAEFRRDGRRCPARSGLGWIASAYTAYREIFFAGPRESA